MRRLAVPCVASERRRRSRAVGHGRRYPDCRGGYVVSKLLWVPYRPTASRPHAIEAWTRHSLPLRQQCADPVRFRLGTPGDVHCPWLVVLELAAPSAARGLP